MDKAKCMRIREQIAEATEPYFNVDEDVQIIGGRCVVDVENKYLKKRWRGSGHFTNGSFGISEKYMDAQIPLTARQAFDLEIMLHYESDIMERHCALREPGNYTEVHDPYILEEVWERPSWLVMDCDIEVKDYVLRGLTKVLENT